MGKEKVAKKKLTLGVVWREARQIIWARRGRLALGLGLLVVSRLAGLVLPGSTKILIDDVILLKRADLLLWIALAASAATILQSVSSYLLSMILGVAAQRSINDMRLKVQHHLVRLPIEYFENHKSGELISRIMNDAEGIRNLVGNGFVQMVGGFMTAGICLVVLVYLNWRLTLITLALLIVFAGIMVVGFSRLRPIFRERGKLTADLTGRLAESLGGIRVIKAYTAEKREERIFARGAHILLRNIVKSMVGVSAITALSRLLFGLVGLAMSLFGAQQVLADRMSVGDLVMFVIFTGLMVAPLVQISSIGTQVTEAFAGLDRIREVFSEPTEGARDAERAPLGRLEGKVEFKSVSFAYNPGTPVLYDISFVTPTGSTTALVGRSGAGKSTVISLAMAFRHPDQGQILIDGRNLSEIPLRSYRSQIAVVLQDDFLFDGTIADNIAYSKLGSTREEVEEAGRLARCDEFVESMIDGYDTVIGERGVKLSGGQRQRVTIARAILADPRILILDEATSSLDSESEAWIQEGLEALKQGRTTFVIAHRLSTIRSADQILVFDEGAIVERGSHQELLAADGAYAALYNRQYQIESNLYVNPGEDFTAEPEVDSVKTKAPQGDGTPSTGGGLLG
jgi:subfamily B ATP-binding cassette protein MsbA